jgi:SAM-dependent methyltransferase
MSKRQRQWTGAALHEMALGHFMTARVIQVAAELDLFTHLAGGYRTPDEVAAQLGVDARSLAALLVACTALELLERSEHGYRTAPSVAAWLVADRPGNLTPLLAGASGVYRDWMALDQAIRTGEAAALPSQAKGADELRAFTLEMHRAHLLPAQTVASLVELGQATSLLDIGGGAGTFAIAFCRRFPHLRATVLDLPAVAAVTQTLLAQSDLSERIRTVGADYRQDPLPPAHDVVLLCNVLHQEDEEQAQGLLAKAHAALRPNGRAVVLDVVLNDDKCGPISVALGSLNQLLHHGGGGYHTAAELIRWLGRVGFAKVQRVALPFPNQALLTADC